MVEEVYAGFGSGVFARPKDESFHSSIHQIKQSFAGTELYPSLEEKAANLLYFIVKNHSFVDGIIAGFQDASVSTRTVIDNEYVVVYT